MINSYASTKVPDKSETRHEAVYTAAHLLRYIKPTVRDEDRNPADALGVGSISDCRMLTAAGAILVLKHFDVLVAHD